ncbi:23S rRNA (pseudouridine(1915)-N(3))-methyltransferase RlmH [Sulfobacillus harzensis]|uniref:23S rRNA (pseudouridine(1915)-N(3))-methyltransferase RlmH n=1 Tax=Sulfobacillus harzensis TaxID=2729629 RepID=UPI003084661F
MSQFRLLTVGRPRDQRLAGLVAEYVKRLSPLGLTWQTVAEVPFKRGQESISQIREGERLLARIGARDFVVLLDVKGEQVDSPGLAQHLERWRKLSRPITVVVGGSAGVSDAVQTRADWRWSLTPLTLPHGLAQVVVAEQLYRAWTIGQGHPYHK